MKKRIVLALTCLCLVTGSLFAQDDTAEETPKGFERSRLFVGGNFGLSFGNFTFINISPQLGYRFNDMFAAGIGINGQFSQRKYRFNGTLVEKDRYGVAGMNLFGRFYPIKQGFIQLQPEMNYIWGSNIEYTSQQQVKRSINGKILPSLLAGAGAYLPAGRAGGLIIMAQYDLLNKQGAWPNPGTPYGNNIFMTVGFNAGF
ncbi:hypothetical protein GCM10027036_22570 [Flavihumibacter cheonanensis]|uniref:hypothetical protein n=1 Tax=Flavihumibacter cheonanensis TaxID=1442385 RepID=UPI001EF96BDD|nr:hypothetical protein [Flavihumibacter cheonanensis]MCG7754391.1 hypothetical protein [Flavihumibacter cheonanensis]